ncbi:MAG: YsnF/AvaK domain-containing protein [Methylibium sp.]|nr:YsnF/AvaK domain-containing protein [Methylibium sp.]
MDQTIALVAEQLEVGKRTVETARVRIGTRVVEREETVEMPLRRDDVEIERVSINRVVEQTSPPRHEGDVTIVPVYEEVLVVTRQLVLKEELRITRRSTVQASEPQRFSLRSEEMEITRTPVGKTG